MNRHRLDKLRLDKLRLDKRQLEAHLLQKLGLSLLPTMGLLAFLLVAWLSADSAGASITAAHHVAQASAFSVRAAQATTVTIALTKTVGIASDECATSKEFTVA